MWSARARVCAGLLSEIETVAPTDATVLIQGETGTGKELLARAIHRLSPRSERTFIQLNCAAIPAGLIESELFGHEKGAFTGAIARKIGRVELAQRGHAVSGRGGRTAARSCSPSCCAPCRRRRSSAWEARRPIPVNVRLIAATNRDLAQMVAEKQFRSDLYYRLKVFPVSAPPLRERVGDIPILVRHFVARHARRMGKHIETIPKRRWPRCDVAVAGQHPRAGELPGAGGDPDAGAAAPCASRRARAMKEEDEDYAAATNPTLHAAERDHILRALREAKGIIGGPGGAAERLGLKRTTLNSKMKKLGIERGDYM